MTASILDKALLVSGMPHILLAPERSPHWTALHEAYGELRRELEQSDADLILYFSTQWLSVIGYLFQARPQPRWTLVDMEWHELGSIPYEFRIDTDFASVYAEEVRAFGYHTALVNYHGFPIDTGTVVAQKLLNPDNRLPAAMVSCNMYSEKNEMLQVGYSAAKALAKTGKKAVAVLVSNLSNRLHTTRVVVEEDRFSSAKDHEWNLKICELLGEGRLEDVAQCAREFARQANGDMGFRGIWWLNGLCGQSNQFEGKVHAYRPIYGAGAALAQLNPLGPVVPPAHLELESENEVIIEATLHDPKLRRDWKAGRRLKTENPDGTAPVEERDAAVPSAETTAPAEARAGTGTSQKIETAEAPEPVGAYPHARREGPFLFLSGVGPRKPGTRDIPGVTLNQAGEVVDHDIEIQTRSVIENVQTILVAAGSSLEQVVDITVFLIDMDRDFQTFNRVYAETFAAIGPTRTTIAVKALPTPIAVEFKVVARAD